MKNLCVDVNKLSVRDFFLFFFLIIHLGTILREKGFK